MSKQGCRCLVKGFPVHYVQHALAGGGFLAVVSGYDALFLKLDHVIVDGSVPGADSLTYLPAAGTFRVQKQIAQNLGTQRVQPKDQDSPGCFFGQRILGLN